MAISIELPAEIEEQLRKRLGNLDQAAKEAFLVELYRQQELTHAQLGYALSLSRYQTDGLLKHHQVYYDITVDDVIRDASISRQARTR